MTIQTLIRSKLYPSIAPWKGIPDRRILEFRIPGTGCQSLSVELGFWIIIASGIPDSLSCIPDSKDQSSAFHRQKISWIPLPGATSTISNFSKISTIEKQFVSLSEATWFPGLFSKKKMGKALGTRLCRKPGARLLRKLTLNWMERDLESQVKHTSISPQQYFIWAWG